MTPIRHRRYRRRLDAYVDGELDVRRARSMTSHLADCLGCENEVRWRRRIKASIAGLAR